MKLANRIYRTQCWGFAIRCNRICIHFNQNWIFINKCHYVNLLNHASEKIKRRTREWINAVSIWYSYFGCFHIDIRHRPSCHRTSNSVRETSTRITIYNIVNGRFFLCAVSTTPIRLIRFSSYTFWANRQ